tara:strand:+ start:3978 stop:4451 length:474 start_codon:yes stop_codon:yes gene_type:complete
MNIAAKFAAAALLASIGMAGLAGTASAGTWHANAAACPDLREDRFDARYYSGRGDRREDFRDRQVIDCPAHAWRYAPDRYERVDLRRMASPGRVYLDRSGRYYAINQRGVSYAINVVIDHPRQPAILGLRFGSSVGLNSARRHDAHRGPRGHRRGRH